MNQRYVYAPRARNQRTTTPSSSVLFAGIQMESEALLRDALSDWGDLELRFADGRSFCVHALKLELASTVLRALMDDVMGEQICSAARQRKAFGAAGGLLPRLQVRSGLLSHLEHSDTVFVILCSEHATMQALTCPCTPCTPPCALIG